jgi:hypothetical protein
MRCPCCHTIIDPRTAWKNSINRFYCSEFCADYEIFATVEQFVQKEVLNRHNPDRLRRFLPFFSGLEIEPKSTIRRRTPMTIIACLRDLFGAEKTSGNSSSSLCCDHCRGKLRFPAHRYWRMRFCSVACMNTYQQRLSPDTRQKICEIDGYRPSWKAVSGMRFAGDTVMQNQPR